MTTITKPVDDKLQSLRDAAHSGQLGAAVSQFLLRTVDVVYAAPGNFKSAMEMATYLDTLTYLVNLHVYKEG